VHWCNQLDQFPLNKTAVQIADLYHLHERGNNNIPLPPRPVTPTHTARAHTVPTEANTLKSIDAMGQQVNKFSRTIEKSKAAVVQVHERCAQRVNVAADARVAEVNEMRRVMLERIATNKASCLQLDELEYLYNSGHNRNLSSILAAWRLLVSDHECTESALLAVDEDLRSLGSMLDMRVAEHDRMTRVLKESVELDEEDRASVDEADMIGWLSIDKDSCRLAFRNHESIADRIEQLVRLEEANRKRIVAEKFSISASTLTDRTWPSSSCDDSVEDFELAAHKRVNFDIANDYMVCGLTGKPPVYELYGRPKK
jgi:hypothetical protein